VQRVSACRLFSTWPKRGGKTSQYKKAVRSGGSRTVVPKGEEETTNQTLEQKGTRLYHSPSKSRKKGGKVLALTQSMVPTAAGGDHQELIDKEKKNCEGANVWGKTGGISHSAKKERPYYNLDAVPGLGVGGRKKLPTFEPRMIAASRRDHPTSETGQQPTEEGD